jgi:formylglycine-generating enzyme required for sulfatase activity
LRRLDAAVGPVPVTTTRQTPGAIGAAAPATTPPVTTARATPGAIASAPAAAVAATALLRPPTPAIVRLEATPDRPALVLIPAGTFRMGSPEGEGSSDEHPQHEVRIAAPFLMGATTVTQAQYAAVTGGNPSHFQEARGGGPDHPVESVTWFDAVNYCNALSQRERLGPAYRVDREKVTRIAEATGYRLPTEAEWEYACRAGTTTRYGSGDTEADLKRVAWYGEGSAGRTHPVAQKPANAWGLYDVHGNVWEWTGDWYASSYPAGPQVDPTGPEGGAWRVFRGGSFWDVAEYARSAFRVNVPPGFRFRYLGFRVVRPAPRAGDR